MGKPGEVARRDQRVFGREQAIADVVLALQRSVFVNGFNHSECYAPVIFVLRQGWDRVGCGD